MAKRIQRRRTKGWRKPEGAVVVSRPTKWGNPFDWRDALDADTARMVATVHYQAWLDGDRPWVEPERRQWILNHLHELRGHDLCCWCPPGEPCHADVLLEIANQGEM